MGFGKTGLLIGAATTLVAMCPDSRAQESERRSFDIPAQDLKHALRALTRTSGYQLIADSRAVRGKQAKALKGDYTLREAVEALVAGSDLSVDVQNGSVFVRGRGAPSREPIADAADDSHLVVTGSRIRGGAVASKTTRLSQDDIRNAGLGTLAEAIRTIPQNFGGGQNPGIGLNVPEGNGANYGSGSSLNLRGLGSDATLTLLNGHRLAYNVAAQSIDISTIPFEAIDRIEVVADGASALYGSDAVAGVANIILKRDFSGLKTTARLGASTDGGNKQQQYGAIAGRQWASGGLMIAGEFARTTPILARQRDYTQLRAKGLYLSPFLKHYSLMASAHQDISDSLGFEIDGVYNKRKSNNRYALDSRGDSTIYGSTSFYDSQSFVVAPSLRWDFADGWQARVAGMFGEDRTRYAFNVFVNSALASYQAGCYCNKASSAEINVDGTIAQLPGGPAKIAIGGGFRRNDFHGYRTAGGTQNVKVSQDAYFAFGEASLPLIGPDQISWLHRLTVNAALRYERYPDVDEVVTPRLGVILTPVEGFDLKGSWGKSFRAPTLFQQYNQTTGTVFPTSTLGGTGYPSGSTVILLAGGNPDLKPERATTWSTTLDIHPSAIPNARVEISYFDVRYRDRIVTPIPFAGQSLSNPIYADLVDFSPDAAAVQAAVDSADVFQSAVAGSFDASKVAAIVYNMNRNVARQSIRGVDIAVHYQFDTSALGSFTLQGDASLLESSQTRSALQPTTELAGTLFNPPKFRGRAGIGWRYENTHISFFANHTGSLKDQRATQLARIEATTTFDASLRLTSDAQTGPLAKMDFILSAQNLLNRRPPLIRTSSVYEVPYDSTNYSAIGRFVSLSVSKQW